MFAAVDELSEQLASANYIVDDVTLRVLFLAARMKLLFVARGLGQTVRSPMVHPHLDCVCSYTISATSGTTTWKANKANVELGRRIMGRLFGDAWATPRLPIPDIGRSEFISRFPRYGWPTSRRS